MIHALLLAAAAPVTFAAHVAPILFAHCAGCHRPGEAAPFPLLTYGDARKHAAQIASVTARRYMPPWPPSAGAGDFEGARRLSDAQIGILAQWAKDGAPEGDAAKTPPAPRFPEGWQAGEPDLIVKMREPFTVPATGPDVFRNFVLPADVPAVRYVRAFELRLDNKRPVHHANVIVDRARALRARDGGDGQPGFAGMDVTVEAVGGFDPDSHFLFWKPGTPAAPLPAGMAWRLEPGTDLVANLHFQPSGKPERVTASIGLYFTREAPRLLPMLLQLEHDGAIDIPPESAASAVTDHLTLPVDVTLLAIYPHAHYLGKRVEVWAEPPGKGSPRIPLLRIEGWDINWQASYNYREPVALTAGTRVAMRIAYDNRSSNPRNPNHPPRRVLTGDRSSDEMGHVWLQVLPRAAAGRDPRLDLQEAAMRRRLEKYPADFAAHFNLGAALQAMGRDAGALPFLEKAVALRPRGALARNSLAASLLDTGRLPEALAHLKEAVRLEPGHADSRFNLARSLTAAGQSTEAVAAYQAYLRLRPDDAEAHTQLAGLYAGGKDFRAAAEHFELAARARPNDADLQANLGAALALAGDLSAAIAAFERAVAIDPNHAVARNNLARARAGLKNAR